MMDIKLFFEQEPMRSRLFEIMFGEISNKNINMYDFDLAEKYMPDIKAFTVEDVLHCQHFDDLPDDWQRYALAFIEKYLL
jgi:hypothetical protein